MILFDNGRMNLQNLPNWVIYVEITVEFIEVNDRSELKTTKNFNLNNGFLIFQTTLKKIFWKKQHYIFKINIAYLVKIQGHETLHFNFFQEVLQI